MGANSAAVTPALSLNVTTSMTGPAALLGLEDWPGRFEMGGDELVAWQTLAAVLRRELDRPSLDDLGAAMAHELLLCLMLSLRRSAVGAPAAPTAQAPLIRRLRRELGAWTGGRPSVALLACRLEVSTSTLAWACKDALGHSAKEEVDRCVALEARRLLVRSPSTSVVIGELLGFSEPPNFAKFFRRRIGTTPEAFRRTHRLQRG